MLLEEDEFEVSMIQQHQQSFLNLDQNPCTSETPNQYTPGPINVAQQAYPKKLKKWKNQSTKRKNLQMSIDLKSKRSPDNFITMPQSQRGGEYTKRKLNLESYSCHLPFEIYMQTISNSKIHGGNSSKRNIMQNLTHRNSPNKLPQLVNQSPVYQQRHIFKGNHTAKSRQDKQLLKSFNQQSQSIERSKEPEPEDVTQNSLRKIQNESINLSLSKVTVHPLTLGEAKKRRKDKDDELYQLHNRIKILQIEEERSLRKIEETRRKALWMSEIQLENVTMQKKQSVMRQQSQAEFDSIVSDLKEKVMKFSPQSSVQKIQSHKQQQVNQIKKQSQQIQREISLQKTEYMFEKLERKLQVQKELEQSSLSIQRAKKNKIIYYSKIKEKEAIREHQEFKKKNNVIKKLNVIESELIRKLKNSHMQQKEALGDLISGRYKDQQSSIYQISQQFTTDNKNNQSYNQSLISLNPEEKKQGKLSKRKQERYRKEEQMTQNIAQEVMISGIEDIPQ